MNIQHIKELRAFNRFYTNIIGLLDMHILNSDYSLPEVRVMYELYHNTALTASDIITQFDIDKSYLSRILKKFEKNNLIRKVDSKTDKRAVVLHLSAKGKKEFENLYEAIAASYNGGEDNAARWLNRSKPKEPAIFTSEVGFAESKNYVFKVMNNYRIYRELYTEDLLRK